MTKLGGVRRRVAVLSAVSALLAVAVSPLSAGAVGQPTGPLAAEMRQMLKLQPDGVQVSDNAMVWEAAGAVIVWPSPGELEAPNGLGSNVRHAAARNLGVDTLADMSPDTVEDVHGCPSGVTVKDYYCFYVDSNFGGRRLQFTGATIGGNAESWGFNNQTSSWVNTDTDCEVTASDTSTGGGLWREPEKSVSSYVGNVNNDKMSNWQCF